MLPFPLQDLPAHVPVVAASRGERIESIHYGSAVVLDPGGNIVHSRGDTSAHFYPRSALKPLFAVAILRAGLQLSAEQIAVAAASHSGSPEHQRIALSTLHAAGLTENDLGNSTDLPYGVTEREDWLAAGGQATQLAQNCSGKHAALLALCQHLGWPTEGYLAPTHPLAQLLADTVEELTGQRITAISTDGCGTQVYPLSLPALARGFARLSCAVPGTEEHQVAQAVHQHPELVAGRRRDVTELMQRLPGAVAKDGFEGIQAVGLADGSALALKIADGSDRARMPLTIKMLTDYLPDPPATLAELGSSPTLGGGVPVGVLTAL